MKVKVCEATGAALDWLVAVCEGWDGPPRLYHTWTGRPSIDWKEGGPIIEREKIQLSTLSKGREWRAALIYGMDFIQYGPTALVAACRCFVASRLGDEVEVPDEIREA